MSAVISWFEGMTYNVLRFDIVRSETLNLTTSVTSHAVEQGANISDHARSEQPSGNLETFVSQKPIDGRSLIRPGFVDGASQPQLLRFPAYTPIFYPTPGGLTQAIGGVLSGPPATQQSISVLKFFTTLNRPEQVLQLLERLRSTYQLIEVNAPSWSLVDCLISNIGLSRDTDSGSGVNFSIDFQGIRRASSKRTAQVLPADLKAKKAVDKGTKGGEETQVPASDLKQLVGDKGSFVAQ